MQQVSERVENKELTDLRQQGFLDVSTHLFSCHDNHQLCGQLNQTASRVTLGWDNTLSQLPVDSNHF